MRNGPERLSCLRRAMKLRRKEKSVGVVKRQVVVKRWTRQKGAGRERRGRAGRTARRWGESAGAALGCPAQTARRKSLALFGPANTWARPVNSEGCRRLPAVSISSVCLEITGKRGLAFPEPALRGWAHPADSGPLATCTPAIDL